MYVCMYSFNVLYESETMGEREELELLWLEEDELQEGVVSKSTRDGEGRNPSNKKANKGKESKAGWRKDS